MTKQELMETYTAEQLAEMVVEMENVSKLRITKCEVSENKELLKGKCDKCGEEFILSLDNKYILCTKAELCATREANRQLNKDVSELQSKAEKYRKAFEGAKEERDCQIAECQKKIEELTAERDFLSKDSISVHQDPIDIAKDLINAEKEYEHNPIAKAFCGTDKGTYRIFDVGELRQIAEHLLVYCNNQKENVNE